MLHIIYKVIQVNSFSYTGKIASKESEFSFHGSVELNVNVEHDSSETAKSIEHIATENPIIDEVDKGDINSPKKKQITKVERHRENKARSPVVIPNQPVPHATAESRLAARRQGETHIFMKQRLDLNQTGRGHLRSRSVERYEAEL